MKTALCFLLAAASVAALTPACRGREERSPILTRKIKLAGGPASGEPERLGGRQDVARGQGLYQKFCGPCHGSDGSGGTRMSKMMRVGNLSDPAVHARLSDEQIAATIRDGKGRMPKFESKLTPRQIKDVIAYVRALKRAP